jgi:hypothetical protein
MSLRIWPGPRAAPSWPRWSPQVPPLRKIVRALDYDHFKDEAWEDRNPLVGGPRAS